MENAMSVKDEEDTKQIQTTRLEKEKNMDIQTEEMDSVCNTPGNSIDNYQALAIRESIIQNATDADTKII